MYIIYRAPGWHGEPKDPVIATTNDRNKAAMMAGTRVDIYMPGECNPYDRYAVDSKTGEHIERVESFFCDKCEQLTPWGIDGPVGLKDGRIFDYPGTSEKHLVSWLCHSCAALV